MNIGEIKVNKIQILLIGVLLLGLITAVYLVQVQQVFKSRAAADINAALEVTDDQGTPLQYQGNSTYKTDSLDVKVGIRDLDQLK